MAYGVGLKTTLYNGDKYYFIPKHRKGSGNPNASIWLIDFKDECGLCAESIMNGYVCKDKGCSWNVLIRNSSIMEVGKNSQNKPLVLSKFIENEYMSEWHGYPADYIRNYQDKPTNDVLDRFEKTGKLSKAEKSRISRGRKL